MTITVSGPELLKKGLQITRMQDVRNDDRELAMGRLAVIQLQKLRMSRLISTRCVSFRLVVRK